MQRVGDGRKGKRIMANVGFYTGLGLGNVTVTIRGLDEVKQKLYALSKIGQTRAASQALRTGAVVIQKAIKQAAPFGEKTTTRKGKNYPPGSLQRSISIQKKRTPQGANFILYRIGPDRNIAYYAHMVEFGTSQHTIKAKKGKFLKFRRTSGGKYRPEFISEQTYAESFQHGSKVGGGYVFMPEVVVKARAHPFVRPGFDSSKFQAVDIVTNKLDEIVKRIAQRGAIP